METLTARGVQNVEVSAAAEAYAELRAVIRDAGLLKRSSWFYVGLIAFTLAGYLVSIWAVFWFQHYALLTLACLSFTFFSIQLAGLMHDSGHRAVFSSPQSNNLLGYVSGGLLGIVFDHWRLNHNAHHAHPNQLDADPDVEIPFIATSRELYLKKKGIERALIRYQAYYYFPLGSIVSFSNRLGSVSYFLGKRSPKDAWKLLLYLAGIAFLFVLPFIVFSPLKAIFVFSLIHITSGLYLANLFAPNHKGMPQLSRDAVMSFLEQQVITSRDIKGGLLTDLALVGLNYQIEHHLFPTCPRNKLKLLTPYVQDVCRRMNLEFTTVGIVETNRMILRELRAVAQAT